MKKLFFTLCALCVSVTMWGFADGTVEWTDSNRPTEASEIYEDANNTGLYFYVNSDGNAVLTYEVASEDNYADLTALTIPATVVHDGETYDVTEVAPWAFYLAPFEGKLTIPATLLYINECSFANCTGLTEVEFEYAETALTDRNTVAYNSSFIGCDNITMVVTRRNITISGASGAATASFSYVNGITTVYIGEYVTEIGHHMYRSNNKYVLSTVICDAPTPPTLGTAAFDRASSSLTLYTQADYVNSYRLDSDWLGVFGRDNIHAYDGEDPDWPTDESAFQVDGIWYEPIEDSEGECMIIADQGGEVYSGEITIPVTVTNEDDGNTYTVTRIDEGAFEDSNIEGHVIIPANILYMGKSAFMGCTGITEVTYEYSPTALTEENNTSATNGSFSGCTGVTTVNLYRDIVSPYTNNGCQQPGAFVGQTSITTINIGPRVTEILRYFFRQGTAAYNPISTINCYAIVPPTLEYSPFARIGENTINVPQGTAEAYSSANVWSDQINSTSTDYGTCTLAEMTNAFAITTHDNGDGTAYATFYNSAANVELFNGELTAYQATQLESENGELIIDISSLGSVIPASTGVVVETAAEGTYLAIATTEDATPASGNLLYGETDGSGYTVAPNGGSVDDYYFYLLSSSNGEVGFYYGAQGGGVFQCQAHRAYLALLKDDVNNNANQISIRKGNGGEDTTGISSVESATEGASVKGIYTIQGVRVSNMNQPGLYIVDGKKVLVK